MSQIQLWIVDELDALKRLQAETAGELDGLLPAILPPSSNCGGTGDRAFKREFKLP